MPSFKFLFMFTFTVVRNGMIVAVMYLSLKYGFRVWASFDVKGLYLIKRFVSEGIKRTHTISSHASASIKWVETTKEVGIVRVWYRDVWVLLFLLSLAVFSYGIYWSFLSYPTKMQEMSLVSRKSLFHIPDIVLIFSKRIDCWSCFWTYVKSEFLSILSSKWVIHPNTFHLQGKATADQPVREALQASHLYYWWSKVRQGRDTHDRIIESVEHTEIWIGTL